MSLIVNFILVIFNLKLDDENKNKFFLKENLFLNNSAEVCGGILYFKKFPPSNNYAEDNFYKDNRASYGKDFCSLPTKIRLRIDNSDNFYYESVSLKVIPGITNMSLNFYFLDFFNQETKDINNGYYLKE